MNDTNKLFLILLSVAIAFGCWVYAGSQDPAADAISEGIERILENMNEKS